MGTGVWGICQTRGVLGKRSPISASLPLHQPARVPPRPYHGWLILLFPVGTSLCKAVWVTLGRLKGTKWRNSDCHYSALGLCVISAVCRPQCHVFCVPPFGCSRSFVSLGSGGGKCSFVAERGMLPLQLPQCMRSPAHTAGVTCSHSHDCEVRNRSLFRQFAFRLPWFVRGGGIRWLGCQ